MAEAVVTADRTHGGPDDDRPARRAFEPSRQSPVFVAGDGGSDCTRRLKLW